MIFFWCDLRKQRMWSMTMHHTTTEKYTLYESRCKVKTCMIRQTPYPRTAPPAYHFSGLLGRAFWQHAALNGVKPFLLDWSGFPWGCALRWAVLAHWSVSVGWGCGWMGRTWIIQQKKCVIHIILAVVVAAAVVVVIVHLDQFSHWGDMLDNSAEILLQSSLQEAIVSSSGMGWDVWHSLMLSIQHFLCWPSHRPPLPPPPKVSYRMVCGQTVAVRDMSEPCKVLSP